MRTLLACLALLLCATPAVADTQTIKIATLAPDGSAWMRLFREYSASIEKRTEGRVRIKFYTGGVQGDEHDVLRKIRIGQLQGAAVTGIGLSSIHPEVRVLDAARNYKELDALRAGLGDSLRKRFEDRGYILAAWGDVGPIHLFTNKPVKSMEDLRSLKIWLWSDDPISSKLFESLGLRGVPMGVPEVLPALSTGTVDAFFGSPLSTMALQWSSHAKFMSATSIGQATGATIVSKKAWDAIAPADQAILRDEASKIEARVLTQIRGDNDGALAAMKKQGLQIMELPPALLQELDRRGEAVARTAGKDFSPEFQKQVETILTSSRKK